MPHRVTPVLWGRCRPSPDRVSLGAPSERHGSSIVTGGLTGCGGELAATSRALDRAGFAVIANGLQQCLTDVAAAERSGETKEQMRARPERLFLSLA